jgi:hypothetical protein
MDAGTALMNPMSFPLFVARTPQRQSWLQPGGCSALEIKNL